MIFKKGDIYKALIYSKEEIVEIIDINGDEVTEVCTISSRNQYFNSKECNIKQFELVEKININNENI